MAAERKCTKNSKELLYAEYMNTSATERTVELIEKRREKPLMKFTKSSVLENVIKLLPKMEASQKELDQRPQHMCDIEVLEENSPFVEMDVTLMLGEEDHALPIPKSPEVEEGNSDSDILHHEQSLDEDSSGCDLWETENSNEESLALKDISDSDSLECKLLIDEGSARQSHKISCDLDDLVCLDSNESRDSVLECKPPQKKMKKDPQQL